MSGHSKWKTIKHKKEAKDQKRSQTFSKILSTISAAARDGTDPKFNSQLKSLIDKARASNVPNDNIKRAIEGSKNKNLKELLIEAYGPGGVAMLIEAITDNSNRTIAEVRHLLNKHNCKMAEPGSVQWAFEDSVSKFPQEISSKEKDSLNKMIDILEGHPDVQKIITNAKK
jgi:YebC/PmpR family DNA-binding regulatory protein